MNSAYRDLLIELYNWREDRKERELAFYRSALAAGELSVMPGKEHTTRKCKCDICLKSQEAGARKFWFQGKDMGFWWLCVCEGCWAELTTSANA